MTNVSESTIVGIDLGTSYCCMGVYKDGEVQIIPSDQGSRSMPSYVSFTDAEFTIGEKAKNRSNLNPKNTVYDSKRLIGKTYADKDVTRFRKRWLFEIKEANGRPTIEVNFKGKIEQLSPEEVASILLAKLKKNAESYLGHPVNRAVITVPANFGQKQRAATKLAGELAGFEVRRIMCEPTAAAMAYGLHKRMKNGDIVLVIDIGGGTTDVSLLSIEDGIFEVLSTAGNMNLGGEDFTHRLMCYILDQFEGEHGWGPSSDSHALQRLKKSAELAKVTLSFCNQATVEIESFFDDIDLHMIIDQKTFESICDDLFMQILEPVKKTLDDFQPSAFYPVLSIGEVVLSGALTRMPKIRQVVKEFFGGKKINTSFNPEESVVYGAAVQAGVLSGRHGCLIEDVLLMDAIPLELGVEISGGQKIKAFKRNDIIPAKSIFNVPFSKEDVEEVILKIYEGDEILQLLKIPVPAITSEKELEVTFDIDADSVLEVSVSGKSLESPLSWNINPQQLAETEIRRMKAVIDRFKAEDNLQESKEKTKVRAEEFLIAKKESLESCIEHSRTWLVESEETASKEELKLRLRELQDSAASIASSLATFEIKNDPSN